MWLWPGSYLEKSSADWWTWPAVAEVLDVEEAGGLISAGVEHRSSAGLGLTTGQEVLGLVLAEGELQEHGLPEGLPAAARAVSVEMAAEGEAEVD